MPTEKIILQHGRIVHTNIGSFAAINTYVTSDGEIEAIIYVGADSETDYHLRLDGTFPVRDQTWKLDQVENPGQENWIVHLARTA